MRPLAVSCAFALASCGGRVGPGDPVSLAEVADVSSIDGSIAPALDAPGLDALATPDVPIDVGPPFAEADVAPRVDAAPPTAVCDAIVDATCGAGMAACCGSHGAPWDETRCRANVRAWCDGMVARVDAGARSFDPSKVDECLARTRVVTGSCAVPEADVVLMLGACGSVFPSVAAGSGGFSGCKDDSECWQQSGWAVFCDKKTVAPSSFCALFTSGSRTALNTSSPGTAVCIPGESMCPGRTPAHGGVLRCAPDRPMSATCGRSIDGCCALGLRCSEGPDPTGTCVPGIPDGARCELNGLGCASGYCEAASTCRPPPSTWWRPGSTRPVANEVTCGTVAGSYPASLLR